MRETAKLTTARSGDRPERPRESFPARALRPAAYVLAGAVAGAVLALTANTMAQGKGPAAMAVGAPPEKVPANVWAHFQKMSSRKPLALLEVEQNGTFRPHFGPNGELVDFDPDMEADHIIGIIVKVSNPKTCWITTTGDEKCVNY